MAKKHQWITTPAQERDYLKLITILQECRKDWETALKKGEPQPEPGEIYATIDAEQNFVNFYSVDRPNPHGITLKPLDLKEDGSLVAQDTKHTTILPLTDIMKCNTVTTRSKRGVKMMLQALTFETEWCRARKKCS